MPLSSGLPDRQRCLWQWFGPEDWLKLSNEGLILCLTFLNAVSKGLRYADYRLYGYVTKSYPLFLSALHEHVI